MDLTWVKKAACIDIAPETFYLNNIKDDLKAIKVCIGCPVMDECLEFAIRHEEHGVWGGTTERERHKMIIAAAINHLPFSHFRKHLPRLQREKHEETLQRKNMRELEHPANVSPLLFACSVGQQKHNQELSVTAAVSLPLTFGTIYRAS